MKRALLLGVLSATVPATYAASDIDSIQDLAQDEFVKFSEDMGAALSYQALAPAEPLGITGFDIALEVTATDLDNPDLFDIATGGNGVDTLVVPKVHVHKGLPANIDIGGFYSAVPNSNIELFGAELRYAFIEGGPATPAVAVRGTYTKLAGVDQLDLETKGLELTASKGLGPLTPYAGAGMVWVTSDPDSSTGLEKEEFTLGKYYLGANVNFVVMNLAFQVDKTGDATSLGAKVGWRF